MSPSSRRSPEVGPGTDTEPDLGDDFHTLCAEAFPEDEDDPDPTGSPDFWITGQDDDDDDGADEADEADDDEEEDPFAPATTMFVHGAGRVPIGTKVP